MIVAINQPYFSPYSGYFSLIAAVDIFVIYDNVQFTRRGRVHRSEIHASRSSSSGWLTLPIKKSPQDTAIADMVLNPLNDAEFSLADKELLKILRSDFDLSPFERSPAMLRDFLHTHLKAACRRLGITTEIRLGSGLGIDDTLKGAEKILATCEKLGATTYINLPGGRDLYDASDFAAKDIALRFLDTSGCSRFGYLQARNEHEDARFVREACGTPSFTA